MDNIKRIIETLLLVSDRPVSIKKIWKVFDETIDKKEIQSSLDELLIEYKSRSIQIEEIAGGYRYSTRPEYTDWVKKFLKLEKGRKLSPAALEVLSIIAYRQPVTKIEIDSIRGVDCGGVIRSIIDKKLIKGAGRKKVIGRPLMYGTSERFLEYFGLASISDLPTLKEVNIEDQEPKEADSGSESLQRRGLSEVNTFGGNNLEKNSNESPASFDKVNNFQTSMPDNRLNIETEMSENEKE